MTQSVALCDSNYIHVLFMSMCTRKVFLLDFFLILVFFILKTRQVPSFQCSVHIHSYKKGSHSLCMADCNGYTSWTCSQVWLSSSLSSFGDIRACICQFRAILSIPQVATYRPHELTLTNKQIALCFLIKNMKTTKVAIVNIKYTSLRTVGGNNNVLLLVMDIVLY